MNEFEFANSHESPSYMQIQTPTKEMPPSLSFGSSSSPYAESPSTVQKSMQSLSWSPLDIRKPDAGSLLASSHLLPSQFPPPNFSALESSPPDAGRSFVQYPPADHTASPQPAMKRVGKRGRPRKYTIDTGDRSETLIDDASVQQPSNLKYDFSSSMTLDDMFSTSSMPTHEHLSSETAASNTEPQDRRKHSHKKAGQHKRKGSGRVKKRSRSFPIFTSAKTKNGVPLFSSKIFEMACQHQNNIHGTEASALRDVLAERSENQSQFSTNGLGFNFSINLSGKVSIEATTRLGAAIPSSEGLSGSFDQSSLEFVKDENDSGSDEETADSLDLSLQTPPRFTSLGSCDAATAFAKTLARTNDNGKGFMFLFPPVSTPDKHAQLTSHVPCTPRTPRAPVSFDETSFSLQMQTPPGAMFPYDSPGNPYTTGMTPYLASARSAC